MEVDNSLFVKDKGLSKGQAIHFQLLGGYHSQPPSFGRLIPFHPHTFPGSVQLDPGTYIQRVSDPHLPSILQQSHRAGRGEGGQLFLRVSALAFLGPAERVKHAGFRESAPLG